jgi:tellurite resistance protein TerC
VIAVSPPILWSGFLALLGACLALDLWLHRAPREVPVVEAARWTLGWVGLGLAFAGLVWLLRGPEAFGQFLGAYVIEWSLSVDNVFVFALIIGGLGVPSELRHRVLFAGAVGALFMRLTFILAGSALLHQFEWVIYPFGAVLLVSAVRFLREGRESRPLEGRLGRLLRRRLPLAGSYRGGRLVLVEGGRRLATPLLLALLLVEATDLLFAVDSIPAVFSMTRDPFIAFSSNALAVLGLRSLYFLVEGGMRRFRHLRPALALVLAFVGLKMIATPVLHVGTGASLAVVAGILATAILTSWLHGRVSRARLLGAAAGALVALAVAAELWAELGDAPWEGLLPLFAPPGALRDRIQGLGPWAPLVFFVAQVAQVAAAPVPGSIFPPLGALLFGPWVALGLSLAGSVAGAALVFGAVRRWGRPLAARLLGGRRLDRDRGLVRRLDAWLLFLILLLPLLPDDVVCALAGLSNLSLKRFVAINVAGRLPGTAIAVFATDRVVADVATAALVGTSLGLAALLGIAALRGRERRRSAREPELEDGPPARLPSQPEVAALGAHEGEAER